MHPTEPRPILRERAAVLFAAAGLLSQWSLYGTVGAYGTARSSPSLDLLVVVLAVAMWGGMLVGLALSTLSALAHGTSRRTNVAFGLVGAWLMSFAGVVVWLDLARRAAGP